MTQLWPLIPLGEVLTERQELPSPEDLALGKVKIVEKISFESGRIQLRANGETKTGMILAHPGDLVVSGINAAKGAIAVYGEENTNRIAATIHYGAYVPNRKRVSVAFLWWLLRSGVFKDILHEHVPGGIKTELKAKRLLPIPIPLPPLVEQQRIVTRIEGLVNHVREAKMLRQRAIEEAEAFVLSVHDSLAGGRTVKLGDILALDEKTVPIVPDGSYPQVGVRSFGGGLFPKTAVLGTETTYKKFNLLYSGALVLSQVKGWEGALAVCPDRLENWFVSPEYRTFRCIDGKSIPGYLSAIVRTEWFWGRLSHATRGAGDRRERTRPEQFLNIEIPMPDVDQQKRGEQIFSKVGALKTLQENSAAEMEALQPAILDKVFRGELT